MGNDASKRKVINADQDPRQRQRAATTHQPSAHTSNGALVSSSAAAAASSQPTRPHWTVSGDLRFPPMLEYLNLSKQGMGLKECRALVRSLDQPHLPHTIRILNLSQNKIGNHGLEIVAQIFLQTYQTIESIDLSKNEISDRGLKGLANAIAANPNLRLIEMNLSSNRITDDGCHILYDSLAKNATISLIDLRDNKSISPHALHMMACIRSRPEMVAHATFESILSPTIRTQDDFAVAPQHPRSHPPTPASPASLPVTANPSPLAASAAAAPLSPPAAPIQSHPQPRTKRALAKQQELHSHERTLELDLDRSVADWRRLPDSEVSARLLEQVFQLLKHDDARMSRFVELSVNFKQGSIPIAAFYTYALESLTYNGCIQLMPLMICALHSAPEKQSQLRRAHLEYQSVKALLANENANGGGGVDGRLSHSVDSVRSVLASASSASSTNPFDEEHMPPPVLDVRRASSDGSSSTPPPGLPFRMNQAAAPPPLNFAPAATLLKHAAPAAAHTNTSTTHTKTPQSTPTPSHAQHTPPTTTIPPSAPTPKSPAAATSVPTSTSATPASTAPTSPPHHTGTTTAATTPSKHDTSVLAAAMQAKIAAAKETSQRNATATESTHTSSHTKRDAVNHEKVSSEHVSKEPSVDASSFDSPRRVERVPSVTIDSVRHAPSPASSPSPPPPVTSPSPSPSRADQVEAAESARKLARDHALAEAAREAERIRLMELSRVEEERRTRMLHDAAQIEKARLAEIEAAEADRKRRRKEEKAARRAAEEAKLAADAESERIRLEEEAARIEREEEQRAAEAMHAAEQAARDKAARKAEKARRKEDDRIAAEAAEKAAIDAQEKLDQQAAIDRANRKAEKARKKEEERLAAESAAEDAKRLRKEEKEAKRARKAAAKESAASIPVPPPTIFASIMTPPSVTNGAAGSAGPAKVTDDASAIAAVRTWSLRYTAQLPQIHVPPMPPPIPEVSDSTALTTADGRYIAYEDQVKQKRIEQQQRAKIAALHAVYLQAQADAQKRDRDQALIQPDIYSLLVNLHTIFPSDAVNQPHAFSTTLASSDRSPAAIKKAYLKATILSHPDKQSGAANEKIFLSKALFPVLQASYQHYQNANKV